MTDINLRPTYHSITPEQKMMVYDRWEKKQLTFDQVRNEFPELHLTKSMISHAIDYALAQINYFTNYREQEIRIIAEQNKTE